MSTKHCHLVLFPAILLTSLQVFPFSNASLWTVLCHLGLGLPLLLFPCGFQSKAFLSMASCPFLSACPIQFHFRLLICVDISISPVLLQSSSFYITSGQWMFRICRKQWLTKVCSFEVLVFISFHVSDPYNNTNLTLLQKMAEFGPSRYSAVLPHWIELYKSTICFSNSSRNVLRSSSIFGNHTAQVCQTLHIFNTFAPKSKWIVLLVFILRAFIFFMLCYLHTAGKKTVPSCSA